MREIVFLTEVKVWTKNGDLVQRLERMSHHKLQISAGTSISYYLNACMEDACRDGVDYAIYIHNPEICRFEARVVHFQILP